jgi:prophage regulatory protein
MGPVLLPFESLRAKGIPLSKIQVWRLEKAGKFPHRIHVSAARVAWLETAVDAYLADRIAASAQVAA